MSDFYKFSSAIKMSKSDFVAMLLILAQCIHAHLDGMDQDDEHAKAYAIGAYESTAFTISCLLSQRYDVSIGTSDVVESLELDRPMDDSDREQHIIKLIEELS